MTWTSFSWAQRACQKAYVHRDQKGMNTFTTLFYSDLLDRPFVNMNKKGYKSSSIKEENL
jgi:hypothetical protein